MHKDTNMNHSLAGSVSPTWLGRALVSARPGIRKRGLVLAAVLGLAGVILLLSSLFLTTRPAHITGYVISAKTKEPISDAMVAVESNVPYEDEAFGSYVRTDREGKFAAETKGSKIAIRVWKPGYAMNGIFLNYSFTLSEHQTTIELRQLEHTNLVAVHDDFFDLRAGAGFSFVLGQVVDGSSSDADLVIDRDSADKTSIMVESQGEGGVIFQPSNDSINFANAREAPPSGYQKRVSLQFSSSKPIPGFLFVRARDGKRYAKLTFGISTITGPEGARLSFDDPSRFTWAYQPDGSRILETGPTKNSFPFSAFGIDEKSIAGPYVRPRN